jgi:hypothetical protein
MTRIRKEAPEQSRALCVPEFSDALLDETTRIWQPLSRRTLTREDGWLGFLDTYRTLCVAPNQEIRSIFDELRSSSSSF